MQFRDNYPVQLDDQVERRGFSAARIAHERGRTPLGDAQAEVLEHGQNRAPHDVARAMREHLPAFVHVGRERLQAFVSLGRYDEFAEMKALLSKLWPKPGDPTRSKLYYEGKVLEAMGLIVEKTRTETPEKDKALSAADRERIHDVVCYIDDHCSADLRISELATIACMSPTKFKEAFKRANGKTFTQYVQSRRISQAELLLRHDDLNIEQVARAVGYTCASRFSTLFKREVGMLPSEFRRVLGSRARG